MTIRPRTPPRPKRRRRPEPMTDADRAFYAGFKSTMTNEDHRRNRDSSIRIAINDLSGTLGALSQASCIREPSEDDVRVRSELVRIVGELKVVLQ